MRVLLLAGIFALLGAPAMAELAPSLGREDPRIQSVVFEPESRTRLVAFPQTPLTIVLLPNDPIARATISDADAFQVSIVGHNDSVLVTPRLVGATASLLVETRSRRYELDLATGSGLAAAFLVRFVDRQQNEAAAQPAPEQAPQELGSYRLSGDRIIRPERLFDDGRRTFIQWREDQTLPAVFGLGADGKEEAVNGHMRGTYFTLDRVYRNLVFRIDSIEAKARRLDDAR